MSAPVRFAVVGAGVMGRNHLRILAMLGNVDLVGIVEPNAEIAASLAAQYGCRVFPRLDDLIGRVDAVSIATPSVNHAESGVPLLENGIHCLIEKPLATSEGECEALIAAAHRSGAKLLVGHIEQFNPAVRRLSEVFAGKYRIHALDARRLGWAGKRITDTDVIADLMVHDLDIVLALIGSPVTSIAAQGISVIETPGADHAVATLGFANGALATLTASRITQNRVRELSLASEIGHVHLDYGRQELAIYRGPDLAPKSLLRDEPGGSVTDYAMERVLVRSTEPLMAELLHFIDVARGRSEPLVTGADALRALRLTWRVSAIVNARLQSSGAPSGDPPCGPETVPTDPLS